MACLAEGGVPLSTDSDDHVRDETSYAYMSLVSPPPVPPNKPSDCGAESLSGGQYQTFAIKSKESNTQQAGSTGEKGVAGTSFPVEHIEHASRVSKTHGMPRRGRRAAGKSRQVGPGARHRVVFEEIVQQRRGFIVTCPKHEIVSCT
eukprot:3812229-Rhodomonas_salina.3